MKAVNRPQKINERRLKEVGGGFAQQPHDVPQAPSIDPSLPAITSGRGWLGAK
ncbi:MAG: hypothetical protein QM831_38160 [Kofleriaceae bacterium]